jgi:ribonuclease P/MRP protein subunit RPP40
MVQDLKTTTLGRQFSFCFLKLKASCISDRIQVISGVPQESILGPTLFLMFINDICDVVSDHNLTMKLLRDDVKIYSELDSGLSDNLLIACSRVVSRAENWQKHLATIKCIAQRITNKTRHEVTTVDCYTLENEHLNWCTELRALGVLVDHNLQFSQHIF